MPSRDRRRAAPRQAKPITQQRLMNAAVYYLGRFEATEHKLRGVLTRKIQRWQAPAADDDVDENDQPGTGPMVDAVITKCRELDLVNDARYGQMRTRQLLRKGKAARMIAQDLRHNGIDADMITALMDGISITQGRKAALDCARKRRVGPYRGARERKAIEADAAKQRQREFGVLARAGHSAQIAQVLLDFADIEAAEQWAHEEQGD